MPTKKFLFIIFYTLLLLIPLNEPRENAMALASVSEQRIVQTYGESELTAKPDLAKINIAIITKSKLADDAIQENARITNTVINTLLDFGLSESDIKTSSYRLHSYRESQREHPEIKDDLFYYQATNEIIVSTNQLDDVGEIIDLAVISGANNINYISFELRDPQDLMLQALQLATRQAYQKAEAIARSLNENIATLLTVKEEKTAYTPFRFQDNTLQREVTYSSVPTPIDPEEVIIRAAVSAEFSLSD
jgi:uncharacterized protein YggE